MAINDPLTGPGLCQWNEMYWFGAQVGGTAWLLAGSLAFTGRSPVLAIDWLAYFVVLNLIGLRLWSRRDQFHPYPAIQAMLASWGCVGTMALTVLYALEGVPARPTLLGDLPWTSLALIAAVVGVMSSLHVAERIATGRAPRS